MRLTHRQLTVAIATMAILAGLTATANATESVRSRVSLQSMPGGLFGYVTSPRASCAQRRQVVVFRQAGRTRDPARDRRVAVAVAKRNRGGYYQWLTRSVRGTGRFYAQARRRPGCQPSTSRTLSVLLRAGDVPVCSGSLSADQKVCRFPKKMWLDIKYGDTILLPCPSFTVPAGACHGAAIAGPWSNPDPPAEWLTGFPPRGFFGWSENGSSKRSVSWSVIPSGGYLDGTVPGPNSAEWTITEAGLNSDGQPDKGPKWYTPNLQGVGPGDLGGPFYIDFENKWWGADVFIWGYLFRRP